MNRFTYYFVSLLAAVVLSYSFITSTSKSSDEIYVMVKYKSQDGKSDMAVAGLKDLINEVKKEPHYKNITIFTDPADPSNILLHEHWESGEYYKGDHMKTTHLQKFMNDSREFLAGPPEITFWKVVK